MLLRCRAYVALLLRCATRADVAERAMIFSQRRERARRYGFFIALPADYVAAMLFTLMPPPLCRRQPPAPLSIILLRFDIIFAR